MKSSLFFALNSFNGDAHLLVREIYENFGLGAGGRNRSSGSSHGDFYDLLQKICQLYSGYSDNSLAFGGGEKSEAIGCGEFDTFRSVETGLKPVESFGAGADEARLADRAMLGAGLTRGDASSVLSESTRSTGSDFDSVGVSAVSGTGEACTVRPCAIG